MNRRAHGSLRLIGSAVVGALLLTGCGGASGSDVTLKLVAADYGDDEATSSRPYWEDLARRFEAANPKIKVKVEVVSWNDIDKRVAELIRSGSSPDLVQTGGFADQVAAKRLYPAADVLSMETQANISEGFAHAGQVLGTQYGIPFVSSSRVFFYNKTIFQKAGITAPPATWSELKADADKIKAKVPGVTPYALPLGPEEAQGESMMWAMSGGGALSDDVGNYSIDSPQNLATFGWLRSNLVEAHLTYPDPGTVDRKTAFNDFATGKVAMLNGHPSLLGKATAAKIDFGTAAIPRKDGVGKTGTLGVADWMMAFKANGHKLEIKQLLNFVYAKQNTLAFDEKYNLLPVTQDTLAEMSSNGKHEDLKQFLAVLPNASFYPLGDPAWEQVSSKIKKEIAQAVTGDAKQVLGGLQEAAVAEAKRVR
ncbi:extracellular solute-binding protein [Kitasatospora sp. NBC_00240]|uniref:extracellular solute-binding protein n=1 Tax=Kitasatospora sp. NBC_00240 TaxID=2903567 RepID=UPI00225A80F6|nr:extracellular solute-binding protein [Kitasatospora sp. NBC_00240]MCX5211324.1 extracellular solute-binding protein [Kitasatospora sp. NBC_00240]